MSDATYIRKRAIPTEYRGSQRQHGATHRNTHKDIIMGIASTLTPSTPRRGASESRSSSTAKAADAVKLLRQDHKEVDEMFEEYETLRSSAKKRALADRICKMLEVHTAIEEEIFYPAVRKALKMDEMLDEATVEHASAKDLIRQIREEEPEDELFDAKVKVLGEYIRHHVKEEHTELFPKVKESKLDLQMLGMQMAERKQALMSGDTEI